MKKAIAIVLSLMFVFALCACNSSDSSTAESSKAEGVVGKWETESYEASSNFKLDDGESIDASIEINDDKTFTLIQTYEKGSQIMTNTVTGTYEENPKNNLEFTCKHVTFSDGSKTQEKDRNNTFSGKLDDDKLTIHNSQGDPHTYIMKRA